jgi:hypothetical protein
MGHVTGVVRPKRTVQNTPEVLAVFGEPRRIAHKRLRPSFETPRKSAAPQDDGRN